VITLGNTTIEQTVAGIIAAVLDLEGVDPHANFFELGGDSLLATQVASRLRRALGVDLELRQVFATPTAAGLATLIDAAGGRATGTGGRPDSVRSVSPGADSREGRGPLSPAQLRLWFLDQHHPGSPAYNMSLAITLRGDLDPRALEAALQAIVERHPALRTTFPAVDGLPVRVVGEALTVCLPVTDPGGTNLSERQVAAQQLMEAEARRPFDLVRGPLFRARLLRLGSGDHLLLITVHHIVFDGWSGGILFRELAAAYEAMSADRPVSLKALPLQYADYCRRQRDWLEGGMFDDQLTYWESRLRGLSPLDLPADRRRPPLQPVEGAVQSLVLPPSLAVRAKALGREEGATLFMTLLAAFYAVLFRYTGRDDVAVGTFVANRPLAELEGLIGFFVNTIVLRADLGGDPTFRELLIRVRRLTLEAYDHQGVPFGALVERLRPQRDPSRPPLVQVTFDLQHMPTTRLEVPGLAMRLRDVHNGGAKFDLSLRALDTPKGLRLMAEYSTALFTAPRVERLLSHYCTLLEAALDEPDRRLSRLPLLTGPERHRVLATWNDTAAAYPRDRRVHELVEEQAVRIPRAIAVAGVDGTLTYEELNRRANRLARCLCRLGAGRESRVGVCLERSPGFIVALLAVLKAGAAYVPLDPAYPDERLRFLIDDAGVRLVVTDDSLARRLSGAAARLLRPEAPDEAVARESSADLGIRVAGDNPAYVIYTSGSTGRPKGVAVTHDSLANLIAWQRRAYGLGPGDRAGQLAGIGFDASVRETWPCLAAGAALHLPPEPVRVAPEGLQAWLLAERVTVAWVPTPFVEPLLALDWPQETALRVLQTGGDRLRVRPPAGLTFDLYNHYGPTEATVVATRALVAPGGGGERPPTIGRPLSNVRVYVLDRHLNPVPVGVPGELYIGGRGVARGYWGRPALTAAAFVPDPFSELPGTRLYRTGDLAQWLPDGELEFLGRGDDQVKIAGHRIELGEIEAVLLDHPQVREAAVAARETTGGVRRLAAYIAPLDPGYSAAAKGPGEPPDLAQSVRGYLGRRLPAYMVPATITIMGALPRLPGGKVDRERLPSLGRTRREAGDYRAPRNPVERALARIWAEMLNLDRVGIDDNFFDLGGDSILSMLVVAAAGREGIRLTSLQLFQQQTIAGLAGLVGDTPAVGAAGSPTAVADTTADAGDTTVNAGAAPADDDDFPLAGLDRETLARVLARVRRQGQE